MSIVEKNWQVGRSVGIWVGQNQQFTISLLRNSYNFRSGDAPYVRRGPMPRAREERRWGW